MGKNAKVEDYAGFWAFCRKKHEIFTNPVFKNPGIITLTYCFVSLVVGIVLLPLYCK